MGQKVNPISFRVGVYRDWDARWFAPRKKYGQMIIEDLSIVRKYIDSALERAEIARVEIERTGDAVRVILSSGRPGSVIGKGGQGIETLKADLAKKLHKKNVDISVQEVKNPETNATLVAKNIAQQLERRVSYKRATKRAALSAIKGGSRGVVICTKGRLGGAEIARDHWTRLGSVPRQTLRSEVDYALAEARTTFGLIGVRVWMYHGEYQQGMTKQSTATMAKRG